LPLPGFTSTELFWSQDIVGAGPGCQNQVWESLTANINVLNGLDYGDYFLEIYTHADVDETNPSGTNLEGTRYANDGDANYIVTFRVDNPPVANCVTELTVPLDATGTASITSNDINDGSTDDFGIDTLIIDIDTFDCSNIGTPVSVTLTVTDSIGQTDTCTV